MIGETVDSYVSRVFPCGKTLIPPEYCDSHGACGNCSNASLIRIGSEIEAKKAMILLGEERGRWQLKALELEHENSKLHKTIMEAKELLNFFSTFTNQKIMEATYNWIPKAKEWMERNK